MRLCFVCLIVMFAMAELFHWLKHFSLPLPIYILGGAFLAIASNYDKRAGWPFLQQGDVPIGKVPTPTTVTTTVNSAPASSTPIPSASEHQSQPYQPISFVIQRSEPTVSSSVGSNQTTA